MFVNCFFFILKKVVLCAFNFLTKKLTDELGRS